MIRIFEQPDYLRLVRHDKKVKAYVRDRSVRIATSIGLVSPLLRLLKNSSRVPRDMQSPFSCSPNLLETRRVAVFAHYDPEPLVSEADLFLIQSLRQAGFAVVVATTAVSTETEHQKLWRELDGRIDGLLARRNSGFDFGSWSTAIGFLHQHNVKIEQLILLNNSVYGPLRSIAEAIKRASGTGDIFGLTASAEFTHHIPSVFLGFNESVIHSREFETFWRTYPDGKWKNLTILRGEMVWEEYFSRHGYKCGSLYQATRKLKRNPYTFFHRELIINGFPFLKKNLFLRNFDDIDMHNWQIGLNISGDVVEMVERDVARLRRLYGFESR